MKQVWLWEDWPGKRGIDKGIDLIAETYCGKIWAIQAKAYDSSYDVTKKDVNKFLSESGREIINFRLLICTTNLLGDNAREVIKAQKKPIGLRGNGYNNMIFKRISKKTFGLIAERQGTISS